MAGKGGGGSWKVAYADFVTAMMAFFLVMWICGQDQKIRRSVSDYFSDPMGQISEGSTKKPTRTGSSYEGLSSGSVPLESGVARTQGRQSYTPTNQPSRATKLVSDWIYHDKQASDYWRTQVKDQREKARWSREVKENRSTADKVAIRQISSQLREEFARDIAGQADGIHRDMLREAIEHVNWLEIAEDLIEH
jgi:flagellar motor protein MotB